MTFLSIFFCIIWPVEWRFSPESKAMVGRNLAHKIGLSLQQIDPDVNII